MSPRVQPFFHPDTHTWTYLVWDPDTKVAAIVDPVLDFDPISGRNELAPHSDRAFCVTVEPCRRANGVMVAAAGA
jgi:hypothetical protein